ncbi:hypothetical protein [Peptostreptococcus faecalis]|uniref:hypothetical protein n=1 Tax=Peptostreptococcus faecalis TaxID=2045015 RepID=UPI0015E0BE1C|nr:hypothetical protein [Peptostreptococcus faecalis]
MMMYGQLTVNEEKMSGNNSYIDMSFSADLDYTDNELKLIREKNLKNSPLYRRIMMIG